MEDNEASARSLAVLKKRPVVNEDGRQYLDAVQGRRQRDHEEREPDLQPEGGDHLPVSPVNLTYKTDLRLRMELTSDKKCDINRVDNVFLCHHDIPSGNRSFSRTQVTSVTIPGSGGPSWRVPHTRASPPASRPKRARSSLAPSALTTPTDPIMRPSSTSSATRTSLSLSLSSWILPTVCGGLIGDTQRPVLSGELSTLGVSDESEHGLHLRPEQPQEDGVQLPVGRHVQTPQGQLPVQHLWWVASASAGPSLSSTSAGR